MKESMAEQAKNAGRKCKMPRNGGICFEAKAQI